MATVYWRRLILRGFGCFHDEFAIDLHTNSLLVLPNESGKSTLVAGLAAIIFGLPASSDPTKFGQARYRNWDDPPRFDGELYFAVDQQEYHLTRDFATHKVTLRQQKNGQWAEIEKASGVDNPNASRPFLGYRQMLQELFGVASLDLFLSTFCLTQPLPSPNDLDAAVQGLLAGAGGGRAADVAGRLENQLREITRHYGRPLGRSRGGNKDRQLEEIQAEIVYLEWQITAGQTSVAELQEVQARLVELRREHEQVEKELETKAGVLQAWTRWRTQQERYDRAFQQQARVEKSLRRARDLEREGESLRQQLADYAVFEAAGHDWGARLERLVEQERELERLQQEQERLKQELEQLEKEQAKKLAERQARTQELAAALRQARAQHDALIAGAAAYEEAQADYEQRFGALTVEPATLLRAVESYIQTGGASSRRQAASKRQRTVAWASRFLGVLLAIVSYLGWGRQAGAVGWGVSLALLALGWGLPWLLQGRGEPAPVQDPVLGTLATLEPAELEQAKQLLERLVQCAHTRPTAEALAESSSRLAKAEATQAGWLDNMGELQETEASARKRVEEQLTSTNRQIKALREQLEQAKLLLAEQGEGVTSWKDLRQRYAAYQQLQRQLDGLAQEQAGIWHAHQVTDLAGLERLALQVGNDLATIRLAWQTLIDENPGLPPIDTSQQPDELHSWYRQLEAEVAGLRRQIEALQGEEQNLLRRQAQLEGQEPINIAVAENRLQELRQEEKRLQLEVEALGLAYRELEAARVEYAATHRERLAEQASHYFGSITGQAERKVELDADFAVSLRGEAGQTIHPVQLSQGAQDQLYLSLRLAIADLLAEAVRLPLILDDPFVNCDSERLERIRQTLTTTVAEGRQVWLLTHTQSFADWVN